jgi:hypothetical protein
MSEPSMTEIRGMYSEALRRIDEQQAQIEALKAALGPFLTVAKRQQAIIAGKSEKTIAAYLEDARADLPVATFIALLTAAPPEETP